VERKDALQTLVNLTRCPSNCETMARHGCLLSTLIQITGSLQDNDAMKAELKKTIVLLAKQL